MFWSLQGNVCRTPANTTWTSTDNATVQLQLSSIYITTAYSLQNSSILSSIPESAPIPTPVSANGMFSVLETVLNMSDTNPIVSEMVVMLVEVLRTGDLGTKAAWTESDLLRSLLAFTLHWVSDPVPETSHVTGYVADETFRIIISTWSRYLFCTLGIGTVCWSGAILIYCSIIGTAPNSSLFPEFDFAAKVNAGRLGGFPALLEGMGNTTSSEVKKRIKGQSVFVGSLSSNEGSTKVAVDTQPRLGWLKSGQLYL
jgi:hypothetical protein